MAGHMDRYYVYNQRYGRVRVPAGDAQTEQKALAYAKRVGSVNLVGEVGPVSRVAETHLIWKAES